MSYQTGYGVEVPKSGGIYLRLKSKGEKVRLRLVSDPIHFHDVLKGKGEDGGDKIVNKTAWIAIHKALDSKGKPEKRVVCFQSGPMVYGLVKDLAEDPDWGDPKLYDIEVTRTEEQGKYYTVLPKNKPMGPLSEEEAALVADANLDLVKLCVKEGAGESATSKPEPQTAGDDEYDPFQDE